MRDVSDEDGFKGPPLSYPSLGADPASQTAEQRAELDDFEKGQLLDDVSV